MIIDNKVLMYEFLLSGKFGNTNICWKTLEEYKASGNKQRLCIRSMIPGGLFEYDFPPEELESRLSKRRDKWIISPLADGDNDRVIQGAVVNTTEGLYLNYSYAQLDWRSALNMMGHHVYRTEAKIILNYYLDCPSIENINYLLEEYPDHVIEFTTYNHDAGTLNNNTLIWEVRYY